MFRVLFQHSDGTYSSLGVVENHEDCAKIIVNHLDQHRYKSYYWRTWSPEAGHEQIDVGSYSEFYHIIDESVIPWDEELSSLMSMGC